MSFRKTALHTLWWLEWSPPSFHGRLQQQSIPKPSSETAVQQVSSLSKHKQYILINIDIWAKLTLYMPWRQRRGEEVWIHLFLTSALDGGKWSIFTPKPHYHQKKKPQNSMKRMLHGPQSWSGHSGDKNISFPCWELNPNRPAHSLVAIPIEFLDSHKHRHSLWKREGYVLIYTNLLSPINFTAIYNQIPSVTR